MPVTFLARSSFPSPNAPSSLHSLSLLSLTSFHVFSFCCSQSYPAFLSCLGSRPPSFQLHFALCAAGARSSAAAPVAFTCLTAPSRLLSRFLFISLSVCLSVSMIVYLPSSSAVLLYILDISSASLCSCLCTFASESVILICWPSIGHTGGPKVFGDSRN